jgi:hypothetical protein
VTTATTEGDCGTETTDLDEGEISKTFGGFFWDIWKERDYRFPDDTDLCYSFMTAVPAIQIFTHLTPPGSIGPRPSSLSHHSPARWVITPI